MKLTDDQIEKMLRDANVPPVYRTKKGLDANDFLQSQLQTFILEKSKPLRKTSATVELIGETAEVTQAFYLLARGLVLTGSPVFCIYARDVVFDEELFSTLGDKRVLLVDGLVSANTEQFTPQEKSKVEWFFTRWLNHGRSAVFLNDKPLNNADEYTKRFRSTIKQIRLDRFLQTT